MQNGKLKLKIQKIKIPVFVFSFFVLFFGLYIYARAYTLLQPLPGKQEVQTLPEYLDLIIPFILGAAAVAAVVIITFNGIRYAVSEAVDSKKDAIDGIQSALLGLLIALMSWLILYTINPDLTILRLNVPNVSAPNVMVSPAQQFENPIPQAPASQRPPESSTLNTKTAPSSVENIVCSSSTSCPAGYCLGALSQGKGVTVNNKELSCPAGVAICAKPTGNTSCQKLRQDGALVIQQK